MSRLDLVPTCDTVYVYQAALVCEDCAAKIMDRLDKKNVRDTGDSDDYPQGPHGDGGGEADSPQFCDSGPGCANAVKLAGLRIGCPLGNPLTVDGFLSLQMMISRDMFSPKKFSRLIGRLLYRVWGDRGRGDLLSPKPVPQILASLPPSLKRLVKRYRLEQVLLCDPENAYLLGHLGGEVHLLRAPVDYDDGEFKSLDVAAAPAAVLEGYDPWKLISQAIADGAWD